MDEYQRITEMIHEVDEAYFIGRKVVQEIIAIEDELGSAGNWGLVDLFGGGFFTTMIKHNHLDAAKRRFQSLQNILQDYGRELSDVNIDTNFDLQIDNLTTFADYFFDGFIFDGLVLNKINQYKKQIKKIKDQVYLVQKSLYETKKVLVAKQQELN